MHRIYIQFSIFLNGEKISGGQFSSGLPTNFDKVNSLVKKLFYYLLALLLDISELKNCVQIGSLSVQATCDNLTIKIFDVQGILPVNRQEITDLLEQNNVSPKIGKLILNYLLSKNSEGQP